MNAYFEREIFAARNLRRKSFHKKFFSNLPLIRKNKFRETYQKFLIPENIIREIKQKYPFTKINSPQNDSFQNKFSGTRIMFFLFQVKANSKPLTL